MMLRVGGKLRHATGEKNIGGRCAATRETEDKGPPGIFEATA
jgi:hypothetical protein